MIDQTENRYKFLKGTPKENTSKSPSEQIDSAKRGENILRLMKYRNMWDAMSSFRSRRQRTKNYERGLQWEDMIVVDGKRITEAEHIRQQGKVPLKNNVILQTQNSIVGVFRSMYEHPEAIARTRDNQQVGEMMTAMLQYVSQINDLKELDSSDFMEGLRSGLAVQYVDYCWDDEKHEKEVKVYSVSPTHVFMNQGVRDVRGTDITCIGMIMDMPLHDVLRSFSKSDEDEQRIHEAYKQVDTLSIQTMYRTFMDDSRNVDFLVPERKDVCRVIQAWEKESKRSWLVIDRYANTMDIYPYEDKKAIDAMIAEREKEITDNGLDPEYVRISCEPFTDIYWYVRYLTPTGEVLFEGESPFQHRSHPFTIYMSRLVDGEIYSFEESLIDQQRYINRLITLNDFIMSASAKGVLVFPENAIPKGMNKEDILEQWSSYRGVIFANLKAGVAMPQQISTNATNIGTNELLALQLQLVRDISGVHGAMLGKEAKSGTAASLYAQEASNAQTNILDTLESFSAFRKRRDYKIAKTIPQCYDYVDYIPVAGREYSAAAKEWNAELASKFDYYIVIAETNNSELYQTQLNQLLTTALQQQLIDFKTALEAGRFPFSDQVLRILERKEAEMAQQQTMQQAMAMQGQATGMQMAEQGMSEASMAQAGADVALQALDVSEASLNAQANQADPHAMEMIQQAIGNSQF